MSSTLVKKTAPTSLILSSGENVKICQNNEDAALQAFFDDASERLKLISQSMWEIGSNLAVMQEYFESTYNGGGKSLFWDIAKNKMGKSLSFLKACHKVWQQFDLDEFQLLMEQGAGNTVFHKLVSSSEAVKAEVIQLAKDGHDISPSTVDDVADEIDAAYAVEEEETVEKTAPPAPQPTATPVEEPPTPSPLSEPNSTEMGLVPIKNAISEQVNLNHIIASFVEVAGECSEPTVRQIEARKCLAKTICLIMGRDVSAPAVAEASINSLLIIAYSDGVMAPYLGCNEPLDYTPYGVKFLIQSVGGDGQKKFDKYFGVPEEKRPAPKTMMEKYGSIIGEMMQQAWFRGFNNLPF